LATLFSSTVEYALRAIVTLASRDGAAVTAKEIADITRSPAGYVSKVMQTLVDGKLVNAKRGPNGGFTLARGPEAITVLDVVNAVDRLERLDGCPLNLVEHADELCPLHRVMDDLIAHVMTVLGKHTMAELMTRPPAAITPMQLTLKGSALKS
jgi:Rrf2 family transcriptional regulator, nitric oxide-sensitive transcriptional repressor